MGQVFFLPMGVPAGLGRSSCSSSIPLPLAFLYAFRLGSQGRFTELFFFSGKTTSDHKIFTVAYIRKMFLLGVSGSVSPLPYEKLRFTLGAVSKQS